MKFQKYTSLRYLHVLRMRITGLTLRCVSRASSVFLEIIKTFKNNCTNFKHAYLLMRALQRVTRKYRKDFNPCLYFKKEREGGITLNLRIL